MLTCVDLSSLHLLFKSPYSSHPHKKQSQTILQKQGVCNLQQSSLRIYTEFSGVKHFRFPIRSIISPDGKVVATGCETGRVLFFNVANGKRIEHWENILGLKLSSPTTDIAWSRTHHFLAVCGFGEQEPPILVGKMWIRGIGTDRY